MKEARHKSYIRGTIPPIRKVQCRYIHTDRKEVSGRQEWDVEGNVLNRRSVSF